MASHLDQYSITKLCQAFAIHQRGNLAEAARLYDELLGRYPDNFDVLHLRGVIALQNGDTHRGRALIEKAIAINPHDAVAYNNLGNALRDLKQYPQALQSYNSAIALAPDYADARQNLAMTLQDLEQYQAALENFNQVIALNPCFANAYLRRGEVLSILSRAEDALASFNQAINLIPENSEAYNGRGNVLVQTNRLNDAISDYSTAIQLNPGYAEAYNNRGTVLRELRLYLDAVNDYEKAIELQPDFAEAMANLGNVLWEMREYEKSINYYKLAIDLSEDNHNAQYNLGLRYLAMGNWISGWCGYEARWQAKSLNKRLRYPVSTLWRGSEPLEGKVILLHAEQGLGDTLQFCRYATLVAGLGAKVLLEVQPALTNLLSGLEGVGQTVSVGDAVPMFDYHCPLMSLPHAFSTDVKTVPANNPYLGLGESQQSLAKIWAQKLGAHKKLRIGLSWSGNPKHSNDHYRSIPLSTFAGIVRPEAEFFCVQKEISSSDLDVLRKHRLIKYLDNELRDFTQTAALLANLDLVITVDTSIAHLAGGMGIPTWVLLPFNPDWRWMLAGESTPWYPSVRLFRQVEAGLWSPVIQEVVKAIRNFQQHTQN